MEGYKSALVSVEFKYGGTLVREVFVQALHVRTVSRETKIGCRRLTRTVLKKRVIPHWTPWPVGLCATGQDSVITNYLKGFIRTAAKFVIHILPQKYVLEFYESLYREVGFETLHTLDNLINSMLSPTVEGVISRPAHLPLLAMAAPLFSRPRPPFVNRVCPVQWLLRVLLRDRNIVVILTWVWHQNA
jgi:hypothetical protein